MPFSYYKPICNNKLFRALIITRNRLPFFIGFSRYVSHKVVPRKPMLALPNCKLTENSSSTRKWRAVL